MKNGVKEACTSMKIGFRVLIAAAVVSTLTLAAVSCAPEETTSPTTPTAPTTPTTPTTPSQPAAKTYTWIFQSPYDLITPYVEMTARTLEEDVLAMSNGRLKITVMAPNAVVPAYNEYEAVQEGVLDGGLINPSAKRGVFGPIGDLFCQFPGGPNAVEWLAWFYTGDGFPLLEEINGEFGFDKVVPIGCCGPQTAEHALLTNSKVESVDDFMGLKIRSYGSWGEILQAVGASVVTLPSGEVYESMQRGLIDAFELGDPSTNWRMHMNEVVKYVYNPGIHSPGSTRTVQASKDRWNELPDDLKLIVTRALQAASLEQYNYLLLDSAAAHIAFQDYGVEMLDYPIDVQAFIMKACDEAWERESASNPTFARVLDNQNEFLDKYRSLVQTTPDIAMLRNYIASHS